MKLEDLVKRADELIVLAERTLATARGHENSMGFKFVDGQMFSQLRAAALYFFKMTFGAESPHYTEFDSKVTDAQDYYTQRAIGILIASRSDLAGGWLATTKGLVSAEVFGDFLSMAEHLLSENYKDAAAVIVGSVLEEHLRQLCQKNSIPVETTKPDGSIVPLKADTLNAELAKANVYSKLDQKAVTAWLDLRNKAAHGHYNGYNEEQVKLMLGGVLEFVARNQI